MATQRFGDSRSDKQGYLDPFDSQVANRPVTTPPLPPAPDPPPCPKQWYQKFNNDHRAGKMHYSGKGVTRLMEGMGLSNDDRDAIIQKALSLLPSKPTNLQTVEGRQILHAAAQQLSSDEELGRYFNRTFSAEHELATDFFAQTPQRWLLVANNEKRRIQREVRANWETAAEVEDEDTENAEAADLAVAGVWDTVDADPGSRARRTAQPARIALLPNTLELRDLRTGQFAVACSVDLFNTASTPEPSQINLGAIRSYWNDHLRGHDLPVVDDDKLRFDFWWRDENLVDHRYRINNDVNLRYAYRLWLTLEDLDIPFVLFLDDGVANNHQS